MTFPKPKFTGLFLLHWDSGRDIVFNYAATTFTATLQPGIYSILGDNSETDFLKWIGKEMEYTSGGTIDWRVDSKGFVNVSAGAQLDLKFPDSGLPADFLGFQQQTVYSGQNAYTADFQHPPSWYPEEWVQMDQFNRPYARIRTNRTIGGVRKTQLFGESEFREVNFEFIEKQKIFPDDINYKNQSFWRFYEYCKRGGAFYMFSDSTNTNSNQGLFMLSDESQLERFPFERQTIALERWTGSLLMEKYEYGMKEEIKNHNFAAVGTGGQDVFRDWEEVWYSASNLIAIDTRFRHVDLKHSCFMSQGTTATDLGIKQVVELQTKGIYKLKLLGLLTDELYWALENIDQGSFWDNGIRKWGSAKAWNVFMPLTDAAGRCVLSDYEIKNIFTLDVGEKHRIEIMAKNVPNISYWLWEVSLKKQDEF